jgi:hypothetical protein
MKDLETTQVERNRKLLQCQRALYLVQQDLGYMSLDEATRNEVEAARTPIGGWVAGLARIEKFMEGDDETD